MEITAFRLAERFVGLREVEGVASSPAVLAMLRLDAPWVEGDETPWCSAFVNYVAWLLRLSRSKSLAARSWLSVGSTIPLPGAKPENDIVVLSRGTHPQPGPSVLQAPGHVGFFAGHDFVTKEVWILGGNQSDAVSVAPFSESRVLGVRRLA